MAEEQARIAFKAMSPAHEHMPDNGIRLRALQDARTLLNQYPAKQIQVDQNVQGDVTITHETMQRAEEHSKKIIDITPEVELVTDGDDPGDFLEPL